jgi:hypothetical protein
MCAESSTTPSSVELTTIGTTPKAATLGDEVRASGDNAETEINAKLSFEARQFDRVAGGESCRLYGL